MMIMMMLIFDKTLSRLGKLMRASTIDQVMMIEAGDKNIVTGKYQNMFFLKILELCDEFVPGDPPEYFFDRWFVSPSSPL